MGTCQPQNRYSQVYLYLLWETPPNFFCSSIDVVHADDTALLKPLAEKFNLTYNAFGKSISQENASASGSLTLSDAFDGGFGPAPTTPIGLDAAPFQLLSGTIRATFKSHRTNVTDGTDGVIVSPGLLPGNSGTYSQRVDSMILNPFLFRYSLLLECIRSYFPVQSPQLSGEPQSRWQPDRGDTHCERMLVTYIHTDAIVS